MKLVIDIPEAVYKMLKNDTVLSKIILSAIADGTPLEAQPTDEALDKAVKEINHLRQYIGKLEAQILEAQPNVITDKATPIRDFMVQPTDANVRLIDANEAIKIWKDKDYIKLLGQEQKAKMLLDLVPTFEAQPMRDATEEERKSVKDHIKSISKPTGLNFDEAYEEFEELDFIAPHKRLSVNLMAQPTDVVSRSEVKDGMLKYGFHAPDMTVTEFVEDCLPSVNALERVDCEDAVSRSEALSIFRANSYPIVHDRNSHDKGMTLTGIEQVMNELPSINPKSTDAVSRETILNQCAEWIKYSKHPRTEYILVDELFDYITELPSIIPQRKQGRWIEVNRGIHVTSYRCSECDRIVSDDTGYDVSSDYPYCHCGAKMGGDSK